MINFRELAKKGVHFGHQTSRWCPKMAPYIWGSKNKTHLISLEKTAYQLEKSAQFLKGLAVDGKTILWVGTKKEARDIVKAAANSLNMPFVIRRWVGGTLSNGPQVKKSIANLGHIEDVIANAQKVTSYTKKELSSFQKKADRLEKNVGGLRKLVWPVGAIVIVDVKKEISAVLEARQMGVPIVGIVDTNSDPSMIDFVIPGNDDAPQSIEILVNYLKNVIADGLAALKNSADAVDAIAQESLVEVEALSTESSDVIDPEGVLSLEQSDEEKGQELKKGKRVGVSASGNGLGKTLRRSPDRKS
jgi:small subunit ribosomal protein S2